jgi:hypothetical protein
MDIVTWCAHNWPVLGGQAILALHGHPHRECIKQGGSRIVCPRLLTHLSIALGEMAGVAGSGSAVLCIRGRPSAAGAAGRDVVVTSADLLMAALTGIRSSASAIKCMPPEFMASNTQLPVMFTMGNLLRQPASTVLIEVPWTTALHNHLIGPS